MKSKMKKVYVIDAVRTPIGRYGGGFGQVDRSIAQAAGLID